ncbi:Fibronectin-binding lipoprotein (plasmid) [Borrelia coriaceae ATCC 43381]|nr:hypothetical protein [Borrelia coriaceae]AHH11226.1 Fibronectin-binding lipoprotein [Borrelia coriaceae ATCC 43381]
MNKTKYLSLSLLLSFISCDLILNDELKDKSVDLLDQIHTVLDAKNDNNIQKNGVLKKFKK